MARMDIVLSILVLTVIALVLGAIFLLRQGGRAGQAALMLALAAVIAGNVAIMLMPTDSGETLADMQGAGN
jgi:predicted Zn-dependent protease